MLLTRITGTENEVGLSHHHKLHGLYFLAVIFVGSVSILGALKRRICKPITRYIQPYVTLGYHILIVIMTN